MLLARVLHREYVFALANDGLNTRIQLPRHRRYPIPAIHHTAGRAVRSILASTGPIAWTPGSFQPGIARSRDESFLSSSSTTI